MRATTATALVLAVLLVGCQGDPEPADPPTSQDALTTTDAAPTTDAPPSDDVSETSAAPDDVAVTTDAGGPPTLPDEARENTEAGAEAFALHYIALLNYSAMTPAEGLIDPLASEECSTCDGFQSMMANYVAQDERAAEPIMTVKSSRSRQLGAETVVFLDSVETRPATLDTHGATATPSSEATPFTMVITMTYVDGSWSIAEIQIEL